MASLTKHPSHHLHSSTVHCLHARSRLVAGMRVWPVSPPCYQHTRSSIQPTPNDSSVEDIIDVLKDAFGTYPAPRGSTWQPESAGPVPASTSRSPDSGFANSSRRGSMRHAPGGQADSRTSDSNSKNMTARPSSGRGVKAGSAAAEAAPVSTAAAPAAKKRKGPFADLITSLEHELLHPAASNGKDRTSSSSSSSSSGTAASTPAASGTASNTAAGASYSAADHTTSSSSQSVPAAVSSSAAGSAAASPRKLTRRIRREPSHESGSSQAQQQQQQQRPQQQQPKQQPQLQQQQQQPPWMLREASEAAAGAAGGRKKQYKPVMKGDLALPGGPAWSALRRHIVAAGEQAALPHLDSLILVEGDQDQRAVARAVNAPVYVCDGTRVLKSHVQPELEMLQQLGRPLVVLTDPDERGRELRLHLENMIGPLAHAFVPEPVAVALEDGPVHEAGNRGIEHVVPVGVQKALANARPSYPADRQVWSLDRLQELQLANAFDGAGGVVRGAAARRRQLCALLGLGKCTAAQLVSMLNRFFDEGDVETALTQLEETGQLQE